jgi:DNA-binding NarL/FixJ family response regulator
MQSSTTSSETPRILLVDDNEAMLARSAAVLSPYCIVVGTARNGRVALEAARTLQPDVIVLDISMPGMSGIELASRLRASGSQAALVFLTVHDDEELVLAARDAGGIGYVVKPRLAADLLRAVQEARAGRPFISPIR